MDPWNDAGESVENNNNNATTSWTDERHKDSSQFTKSSPPPSPKFNISGPVDPWAENVNSASYPLPGQSIQSTHDSVNENDDETRSGEKNDFDPWGGGSVPMTTSLSSTTEPDAYRSRSDELQTDENEGWQPSQNENEDEKDEVENNEPSTAQTVDEDDPWGSGAQARRIKAEADAEAAAQRMEIMRLQDEAKGEDSIKQAIEQNTNESQEAEQSKIVEKSEKDDSTTSSAAPAPSTTGGWRSFFTRTTGSVEPNNTSRAPTSTEKAETEKGSNAESSPRNSTSTAAPRLWQAPSLRTGHVRTASNGTQGSGSKMTSPVTTTASLATQGPGWEVTTKKEASSSSGGFIQSFLGGGQGKEGSALSKFTNSLQRPPVVSASDPDEDISGDVEDTGIEWDGDKSFDNSSKAKQTKPQPDLLSNDLPQESAVTRIFGRFRGKQNQDKIDGEMQNDDLSWLENIGNTGDSSKPVNADQSSTNEDDWLAFVEGRSDSNLNNLKPSQATSNRMRIPNAGETFSIPNLPKLAPSRIQSGPLSPPPRLNAPPSRLDSNRSISSSNVVNIESSPDPDTAFGSFTDAQPTKTPESSASYRDEPDSHDDALLSRNIREQGQMQKRKTNFLSSFTTGGRIVKPYTFDNDDEDDVHNDNWSAFKDVPEMGEESNVNTRQSVNKVNSALPPRQDTSRNYDQRQNLMQSNQSSFQNSTTNIKNTQFGILPPPPASNRNVLLNSNPSSRSSTPIQAIQTPTTTTTTTNTTTNSPAKPMMKTLSQGKSLTNDDLSFFENL